MPRIAIRCAPTHRWRSPRSIAWSASATTPTSRAPSPASATPMRRRLSDGARRIVHVTVAGIDDIPIDEASDLLNALAEALRRFGDPTLPVRVKPRELLALVLSANVTIDPDYLWDDVAGRVRTALRDAFAFAKRALGQPAYLSEAIAAIQAVAGVVAVDVDVFDAVSEAELTDLAALKKKIAQLERRRPCGAAAAAGRGGRAGAARCRAEDVPVGRARHPARAAGVPAARRRRHRDSEPEMTVPTNDNALYDLLPTVYRLRDVAAGYPLRDLLRVLSAQVSIVEADIAQQYDDWFVETAAEWVLPYIGDLVGWVPPRTSAAHSSSASGRTSAMAASYSPRREIANTVAHRRRKGTFALLSQLAFDVAGWPAVTVEFYRRLAYQQHVDHRHLDRGDRGGSAQPGRACAPRRSLQRQRAHRRRQARRVGALQRRRQPSERRRLRVSAPELSGHAHTGAPARAGEQQLLQCQPARQRCAAVRAARAGRPAGRRAAGNRVSDRHRSLSLLRATGRAPVPAAGSIAVHLRRRAQLRDLCAELAGGRRAATRFLPIT